MLLLLFILLSTSINACFSDCGRSNTTRLHVIQTELYDHTHICVRLRRIGVRVCLWHCTFGTVYVVIESWKLHGKWYIFHWKRNVFQCYMHMHVWQWVGAFINWASHMWKRCIYETEWPKENCTATTTTTASSTTLLIRNCTARCTFMRKPWKNAVYNASHAHGMHSVGIESAHLTVLITFGSANLCCCCYSFLYSQIC